MIATLGIRKMQYRIKEFMYNETLLFQAEKKGWFSWTNVLDTTAVTKQQSEDKLKLKLSNKYPIYHEVKNVQD